MRENERESARKREREGGRERIGAVGAQRVAPLLLAVTGRDDGVAAAAAGVYEGLLTKHRELCTAQVTPPIPPPGSENLAKEGRGLRREGGGVTSSLRREGEGVTQGAGA